MIGTRLERYEQSHRHLSAAARLIESLALHAEAGEHLALEVILDEARKSLGALERTISIGLARLDDAHDRDGASRTGGQAASAPPVTPKLIALDLLQSAAGEPRLMRR